MTEQHKQPRPNIAEINADEPQEPIEREATDQGFTTNVSFTNPGSQADLTGFEPLPSEGSVGAHDPGGDGDLAGMDQIESSQPQTRGDGSGGSASRW